MARAQDMLEPYLHPGVQPNGDVQMTCPLHDDGRRSATVNFRKRVWVCHAGCGGGRLTDLIALSDEWLPPVGGGTGGSGSSPQNARVRPLPTVERLEGYHERLLSDQSALDYLRDRRGFTIDTINRYGVGWNGNRYIVPIEDEEGTIVNVRYFQPDGKPKWLNHPGHGSPARLHPIDVVSANNDLVWHEGEFDSWLSNQNDLPAFTATGGAKIVWQDEWDDLLRGKNITLCFDADFDGRNARNRVMPHLKKVAASIKVATLPFKITKDHGKDISDWWLDGHSKDEFWRLTSTARAKAPSHDYKQVEFDGLRDHDMRDEKVAVQATISMIEGPQLLMPRKVEFTCSRDWKPATCKMCPLGRKQGNATITVNPGDQINLDLIHKSRTEPEQHMKRLLQIPSKCPVVDIDWTSRTAWHGEVRNGSNLSSDSLPMLLFTKAPPVVGTTVELTGQLKYTPRQASVLTAAGIRPVETELDRFQLSEEQVVSIRRVMDELPTDPREALDTLAEYTEDYVTHRYGQRWLHICSDLVYHSVLSFRFQDELLVRGWLELLAVGETRVGKSTTLSALAQWYGRGEIVPCEKTSIPGLVSTTEKRAGGRGDNWVARVGKLPLLDRQLAVFDEAQGLKVEHIGQLSDARSAGMIRVTQAASIDTKARVRLIWLANPRRTGQTGIRALVSLMGKEEDIARVDLPMFLKPDMSEKDRERRDSQHRPADNMLDQAVARDLLYWAWSRKPRDVIFHPGAAARVREVGDLMADKYYSRIPLMPRNEARVRVARLAVAIAARLFSSDEEGRKVRVTRKHVSAAGWVYAKLLKHPDLEYMVEVEDMRYISEADRLHGAELRQLVRHDVLLTNLLRESEVDTRKIGQFFGQDSQYYLTKLINCGAIVLEPGGYRVPEWARKIAQESRK